MAFSVQLLANQAWRALPRAKKRLASRGPRWAELEGALGHGYPILIFCLAWCSEALGLPAWEMLGPPGGIYVSHLAASPHDPDVVVAVDPEYNGMRLWQSTDAGLSWHHRADAFTAHGAVWRSLAWDSQARGVAYAGVLRDETCALIYRTLDKGRSWTPLTVSEVSAGGWIAADPHVGGRIWVGLSDDSLWRSVDGGESFTPVAGVTVGMRGAVWSDPANPEFVLCATRGIFASNNGGQGFTLLSSDISGNAEWILSDPAVEGRLLCSGSANWHWQDSGVWHSDDLGASWERDLELKSPPPSILVDAGTSWIYACAESEGFYARSPLGRWEAVPQPTGRGVYGGTIAGSLSQSLLVSTPSGIFRSELPLVDNWTISSEGFAGHRPSSISVAPDASELVLIVNEMALLLSENGGGTWRYLNDGPRELRILGATLLQSGWIVAVDRYRGVAWSHDLGDTWLWQPHPWDPYRPFGSDDSDVLKVWTSRADPTRPLIIWMDQGGDYATLHLYLGPASPDNDWELADEAGDEHCGNGGNVYVSKLSAASSWADEASLYANYWITFSCHGGLDSEGWLQRGLGPAPPIPDTPPGTFKLDSPADAQDRWFALAEIDTSGNQAIYRRIAGSWQEVARGEPVNGFDWLSPLQEAEGGAWIAAGPSGSWLTRDSGETWRELETAVPLPFYVLTTEGLPAGTVLSAGRAGAYRLRGVPTTVNDTASGGETPQARASLDRPRPVPANPRVSVPFSVPERCDVNLAVYDLQGRLVAMLVDEPRPAGRHSAVWDGKNSWGMSMPSGAYFVRLSCRGEERTARILLLR